MRGLLLLVAGCAGALQPPSGSALGRRDVAIGLGITLALAPPFAAHASRSRMIERPSKEAAAAAKAFKFSKPSEPSEDLLANERRRNDFAAGVKPRDAARIPVRDAISGKNVCAEIVCKPDDAACYKLQGSCGSKK